MDPSVRGAELQSSLISLLTEETEKSAESIVSNFLSFLETHKKLRQIPELFGILSKVFVTLREEDKLDSLQSFDWSSVFLDKFAIVCEELSISQFLSLWEIILKGMKEEFQANGLRWITGLWTSLLSNLLMRARLLEQSTPQHFIVTANTLMTDTAGVLKVSIKKFILSGDIDNVSCAILSLVYVWGELHLMLHQYTFNTNAAIAYDDESASDLRCVHIYMTSKMCIKLQVLIENSTNMQLNYLYSLLLVQKIKYRSYNECKPDNEMNLTTVYLANIVQRNLTMLCTELSSLTESEQEVQLSYWESILEHFSLMTKWWPYNTLADVAASLIDFALSLTRLNTIYASKLVKYLFGSCYIESKAFQTAFVSSFAQKMYATFSSKHRSQFEPFFSVILENQQVWVDEADLFPIGNNNALSWQLIQKAGQKLSNILMNTDILSPVKKQEFFVQVEEYLQLVTLLPVGHLLPGNQTRLVFVLLTILHCLEKQTTDRPHNIRRLCLEILKTILDGIRSVWFLDFFPSDSFVLWFLSRVGSCVQDDKQKEQVLAVLQTCLKRFSTMVRKSTSLSSQVTILFDKITTVDMSDESLFYTDQELWIFVISTLLKEMSQTRPAFKSNDVKMSMHSYSVALAKSLLVYVKSCNHPTGFTPTFMSRLAYAYALSINIVNKFPKKFQKWKKYFPRIYNGILQINPSVDNDPALIQDLLQFYNQIIPFWESIDNEEIDKETFVLHFWKFAFELYKFQHTAKEGVSDQLRKNLISTCETAISNSFTYSTKETLHSILENILLKENDDASFQIKVKCWRLIMFSKLPSQNLKTCRDYVEKVVKLLLTKMENIDFSNEALITDPYIPSQELIIHFIQQGKKALSYPTVELCFSLGCEFCKYTSLNNIDLFCEVVTNGYQIVSSLYIHQREIVESDLPAYLVGVNGLFEALLKKSDVAVEDTSNNIQVLVNLSHNINRIFSLMASNKTEFCKAAPYIICEYLYIAQEVAVAPLVMEALSRGLYDLLDTCDEHGINMLHSNLPYSKKEIFKQLLHDYEKRRKLNQKFKRLKVR